MMLLILTAGPVTAAGGRSTLSAAPLTGLLRPGANLGVSLGHRGQSDLGQSQHEADE